VKTHGANRSTPADTWRQNNVVFTLFSQHQLMLL